MNPVERLINNFRETERKLKEARKLVRRLEEREEKYQGFRRKMKEMKKRLQFLEQKLSNLERKDNDYKLVRVYPTQDVKKCGNKKTCDE